MICDLNIYRAAHLVIKQHGDNAQIEAAKMIDLMLANGDEEGRLEWRRIKRAIEALQRRRAMRRASREERAKDGQPAVGRLQDAMRQADKRAQGRGVRYRTRAQHHDQPSESWSARLGQEYGVTVG